MHPFCCVRAEFGRLQASRAGRDAAEGLGAGRGGQVVDVGALGEIGLARVAADDVPDEVELAASEGLGGQRRDVEGAQARGDDEDETGASAGVAQRGSVHGDELTPEGFVGNHAGGVLGGISTGQDITVSIAIKPTSSIRTPRRSIDKAGQPAVVETFGRHDPCVGIRGVPVVEAMMALVLADQKLLHRAQCG